jgi:cold shock protein
MIKATVREWYEEEGWGVLDSAETPGGCFAHFSDIELDGYRTLENGQTVWIEWERPGFKQDGYDYRATTVRLS